MFLYCSRFDNKVALYLIGLADPTSFELLYLNSLLKRVFFSRHIFNEEVLLNLSSIEISDTADVFTY